jgi:hypothetical protein
MNAFAGTVQGDFWEHARCHPQIECRRDFHPPLSQALPLKNAPKIAEGSGTRLDSSGLPVVKEQPQDDAAAHSLQCA